MVWCVRPSDGIQLIVLGPIPLELHYSRSKHLRSFHGWGCPAIPDITPNNLVQAIFIEALFNELYMMDQSVYNVIYRLVDFCNGFIIIVFDLLFYLLLFDALDLQFSATFWTLTKLRYTIGMNKQVIEIICRNERHLFDWL